MSRPLTSTLRSQFFTRKSSCVNARGIPPAVYWVLLLLSYLGTPPSWPGWGGGLPDQGTPPGQVPPCPDLAGGGGTWPGYPLQTGYPPTPSWPGWGGVPHQGTPPAGTWQGTTPLAGPSRVPPPPPPVSAPWLSGKCCKALWDMGTPPVDRQIDRQMRVKTLPSRRTTYAGGKNYFSHLWT